MGRERGQTTIEYLGVLVVLVALLALAATATPSVAQALRGGVEHTVCAVTGGCPAHPAPGSPGGGAPAPRAPTRAELRSRAYDILNMSLPDFLAYKRDHHPRPFDWSSDGCSDTPPAWADLFEQACQLHDFGYRNLGAKGLDRNEDARDFVDHRFLEAMQEECHAKFGHWYRAANYVACMDEATIMFGAVRNFGRSAFYH